MAAHGRLLVRAARAGDQIDVVVQSDPLNMIAAVAAGRERAPLDPDHRARITAGPDIAEVSALDEHGNQLVTIATPPERTPEPEPAPPVDTAPRSNAWPWFATGAGITLGVAVGAAALAVQERETLNDQIARSGDHFLSDVEDRESRVRLRATIAIVSGSIGVVLAVPAVILYARAHSEPAIALRPMIGPGLAGIAGTF